MSFGRANLTANLPSEREEEEAAEMLPGAPFRILVMGDFSGRAARRAADPGAELTPSRPIKIDRDNYDDILARLAPTLPAAVLGLKPGDDLEFREIDDFLPDAIIQKLTAFDRLKDIRERLSNASTFPAALAEIRGSVKSAEPAERGGPAKTPEELLAEMLGDPEPGKPAGQPRGFVANLQAYMKELVGPYLIPGVTPEQEALIQTFDQLIAQQMRGVLHRTAFKSLEAAWLGLKMLVRRLDTDNGLQIHVLDLSRMELAEDLCGDDLGKSALYKLLVEQTVGTPGGVPWAVVLGDYTFQPTTTDAALLGRLSLILEKAGTPFIAAAGPRLAGCESFVDTPDPDDWKWQPDAEAAEAWAALRQFPEAVYLGLALPRFLVRLPYGPDTLPTERLTFREVADEKDHESFLWGNPAFVCGCLLGASYNARKWSFRPGQYRELDELPLYYGKDQYGEPYALPCAETVLNDRATAAILDRGLMPLLTILRTERVQLHTFQSLAATSTLLRGRWHS